jgi:hypothetical protein
MSWVAVVGGVVAAGSSYYSSRQQGRAQRDAARRGASDQDYGREIMNTGLEGLDNLERRSLDDLDSGGLPDYMEEGFGLARGRLTDDAQRSRRAFAEDLQQIARRSGGRFDPNSAVDYQIEREADIDEDLFNARNDLSMGEANVRMENTNRLFDRIFAIQDRRLGAGGADANRGIQQSMAAMEAQRLRDEAAARAAAQWAQIASNRSPRSTGGG